MENEKIIDSVDSVLMLIQQTINDLKNNKIDSKKSNAIGFLLNTAIKCIEIRDLKDRLDKIEQRIDFSKKFS